MFILLLFHALLKYRWINFWSPVCIMTMCWCMMPPMLKPRTGWPPVLKIIFLFLFWTRCFVSHVSRIFLFFSWILHFQIKHRTFLSTHSHTSCRVCLTNWPCVELCSCKVWPILKIIYTKGLNLYKRSHVWRMIFCVISWNVCFQIKHDIFSPRVHTSLIILRKF